jgi:hypothetical protein
MRRAGRRVWAGSLVDRRIDCMIVEVNASWDLQYTVQIHWKNSVQDELPIFTEWRVKNG